MKNLKRSILSLLMVLVLFVSSFVPSVAGLILAGEVIKDIAFSL